MNQYPLWKYLLILVVVLIGAIYALPNLYGEDPALQISSTRGAVLDAATEEKVVGVINEARIPYKSAHLSQGRLLVRFRGTEGQLKAMDLIQQKLGEDYVVALNLAPATPGWLIAMNALPMYLGLDLRGGVHFLLQVDMQAAIDQAQERYVSDLRTLLRDSKVRYVSIVQDHGIKIRFRDAEERANAQRVIGKEYPSLQLEEQDAPDGIYLLARMGDAEQRDTRKFALQQNIVTLRNRVNELGVAEPVIQQQGEDRVVVQLPGVQDTARAKEILGATATLEYRMVDTEHSVQDAVAGHVPAGSRLYYDRKGVPILLDKRVIVTGDQITNASSGIDQQSGQPAVFVSLDAKGARKMGETTRENIGKPMAVVYIENKPVTRKVGGKTVKTTKRVEEVINVAVIRDAFSNRFQTTGLDSMEEAHNLALLLRAGALAAPIEIIEERTVGPSLGQENIDQGFDAAVIGFVVVVIFMAVYYQIFGLVADLALAVNLILIVAIMSMLQATLTLPGIAGIVLTLGMAVDANVLIFERIREELRSGNTPQASIHAGYEKAFSTIADANITTLIAAVVLFGLGTGPVKGFAVTLSIGILTSMFTAIMGSRAVVNLLYGGRRLKSLPI